MKVSTPAVFLLLVITLLVHSCTVEKRRYLSGYHVDWFGKDKAGVKPDQNANPGTDESSNDISKTQQNEHKIHQPLVDHDTPYTETKSHVTYEPKQRKSLNERMARQLKLNYLPAAWAGGRVAKENRTLQDYHPVGVVFGMVALILSILTIAAFIVAIIVAEGWAALGWIAIAVVLAVATLLFATIAQIIFWSNGQGIPAFMILPLIVSVFAIYVSFRLVFDRIFRNG